MEQEDLYQDIPSEFYSFETSQPFEKCIECECYLLEDKEYVIEKAVRKYKGFSAMDTVFDYAICIDCAMRMRNEFSKESLAKIDAYLQGGLEAIQQKAIGVEKLNVEQCLKECIIHHHAKDELEEYQIYAYCHGDKLFKGVPPYMVGGPAIDEILSLLSNPTIDFLDGFYNKHFSPDPTLMEPTPSPKLVFV